MSGTVVGSIAWDSVTTPFGEGADVRGAATHFALAASFLDEVRPVGPVGRNFAEDDLEVLATRRNNVGDVERVDGGLTSRFRVSARDGGARPRDAYDPSDLGQTPEALVTPA